MPTHGFCNCYNDSHVYISLLHRKGRDVLDLVEICFLQYSCSEEDVIYFEKYRKVDIWPECFKMFYVPLFKTTFEVGVHRQCCTGSHIIPEFLFINSERVVV